MHGVIDAVTNGKNLAIESPTGTGKSASLLSPLCSIIRQLQGCLLNEQREYLEQKQKSVKSSDKPTPSVSHPTTSTSSSSDSSAVLESTKEVIKIDSQEEVIHRPQPLSSQVQIPAHSPMLSPIISRYAFNEHTTTTDEEEIMDIEMDGTMKKTIYKTQNNQSTKTTNPLKTEKTGSSPDLAPPASSIPGTIPQPSSEGHQPFTETFRPFQLIFSSRTHAQVEQLSLMARKTGIHVSSTVLASRKHMCVNEFALKQAEEKKKKKSDSARGYSSGKKWQSRKKPSIPPSADLGMSLGGLQVGDMGGMGGMGLGFDAFGDDGIVNQRVPSKGSSSDDNEDSCSSTDDDPVEYNGKLLDLTCRSMCASGQCSYHTTFTQNQAQCSLPLLCSEMFISERDCLAREGDDTGEVTLIELQKKRKASELGGGGGSKSSSSKQIKGIGIGNGRFAALDLLDEMNIGEGVGDVNSTERTAEEEQLEWEMWECAGGGGTLLQRMKRKRDKDKKKK
ncbi:Helicase superfamily 1/2, DinG/Rad3-like protein, partial [Aduncisulcus paluster]